MNVRWIGAGVVWAAYACGTDAAVVDAGSARDSGLVDPDAGGLVARSVSVVTEPAEPASAALPQLTPCPVGWMEGTAGRVTYCEPWAADDSVACPLGSARRPGEACEPIGNPCDAGDWATDLPSGQPVVYVRTGGGGRQEGTQAAPFRTIAAAIAAANDGDTIAIAKGSYTEVLRVERPLTLHGACAQETTISGATATGEAVVSVRNPSVEIRNVTVSGSDAGGIAYRVGGSGTLEGVVIHDVRNFGVRAREDGDLLLEDVEIRDINPRLSDGTIGRGLDLLGNSRVEGNRVSVVRAIGRAVRAEDGVDLHLTDSVVRETRADTATPRRGRGIEVRDATAALTRVLVEDNVDYGVIVTGPMARAVLRDVLIRDTWFREDDNDLGRGLHALGGAQVDVERVSVQRSHNVGVVSESENGLLSGSDLMIFDSRPNPAPVTRGGLGLVVWRGGHATLSRLSIEQSYSAGLWIAPGSEAVMEDVTVHDVAPKAGEDTHGNAIAVTEGGRLELVRAALSGSRDAAIDVAGAGSFVELQDVTAQVTSPQLSDDGNGVGMLVHLGAQATIRRARFDDHHEAGLMVVHQGTSVVAEDFQISGIRNSVDQQRGRGISVQDAASLELHRARIVGVHDVGVLAVGSMTQVVGSDWSVTDLQGRGSDGRLGRGVDVSDGARATVDRLLVDGGRESALYASGEATAFDVRDVSVVDTLVRACASESCAEEPAGNGASSMGSARLSIANFVVARSPLCGVLIGEGSEMSLTAGDVAGNLIGLCSLDPDGFDLEALQDVRFFDNVRRLDAVRIPVPDPALPGDPGEPFSL